MADLGMTMCLSVYMFVLGFIRRVFVMCHFFLDDQEDEFLSGVRVSCVLTVSDQ